MDYKIEKLEVESGDVLILYYTPIPPHQLEDQENSIQKIITDLTNHYKKHGKDVRIIALPRTENLNSNN